MHYLRTYRTGSPYERTRKQRGLCSEEGCSGKVRGRGLCDAHYMRWYSGSTATGPIKRDRGSHLRPLPDHMSRKEWVIYAAGFIDGEGCISIVRKRKHNCFYLCLSVGQVDPKPLQILKSLWAGCIKEHSVKTARQMHFWTVTCRQAQKCISEIEPYLIVKKSQALIALKFAASINSKNRILTKDTIEFRDLLCKQMTAIKQETYSLA
jgi:hypothetical protein